MIISRNKPIHLIQVFSNCYHYNKEYKEYSKRKEIAGWKEKISAGSFLSADLKTLVLSKDYYGQREGIPGNTVILVDYNPISDPANNSTRSNTGIWNPDVQKNVWFCSLSKGIYFWKIFKLTFDEKLSIFLQWDEWKVGFPKRQNDKIIQLKINQPVEVIIDGKRDFSMSGGRERIFMMNDYIFEYKGLIGKIEISKKSFVVQKQVPRNVKKINLLKYVR
jgi:hypothetical protein